MLQIEYKNGGDEFKNLSAEQQHAKIAYQRASHIRAIFSLLTIADVAQHYRNCETSDPNEDLTITLRGIGELGQHISEGLWNEIDCLETIAEKMTTFLLPETTEVER